MIVRGSDEVTPIRRNAKCTNNNSINTLSISPTGHML